MIKLKELLNEFQFFSGDAGHPGQGIEVAGGIYLDAIPHTIRGLLDLSGDEPAMTKRAITVMKKTAIWSEGNLFITHLPRYEQFRYFLIDETEKFVDDAFIGTIHTTKADDYRFNTWSPATAFDIKKAEEIHWSFVSSKYKGKGYGKLLYDAVLNNLDALFSDDTLFDGSYNMWTKHVINSGGFFGIQVSPSIIIPADVELASKKEALSWNGDRFVVVNKRVTVPKVSRKIGYNLRGIDVLKELAAIHIRLSHKDTIRFNIGDEYVDATFDEIVQDYATSMQDLAKILSNATVKVSIDYNVFAPIEAIIRIMWAPGDSSAHSDIGKLPKGVRILMVTLQDATFIVKEHQQSMSAILL